MLIKWKYNDHGHPDFEELEIPDDFDGYESVEDYLCEINLVPTWSERFMKSRIKWEKLNCPRKEILMNKISHLKNTIKWSRASIKKYEEMLKGLTK